MTCAAARPATEMTASRIGFAVALEGHAVLDGTGILFSPPSPSKNVSASRNALSPVWNALALKAAWAVVRE